MSISAYKAVWANSKQTGSTKLTLLALAEFVNSKNDAICWPSIKTLAEMTGTSERQVKRNIVKLVTDGEIQINRNVGRGSTNEYDLSPTLKGDMGVLKGDADVTISEKEKVTPVTEKVTPMTGKGDTDVTQTLIEPERTIITDDDYGAVFSIYEQEIGMMSKVITDHIEDAVKEFGPNYVKEAIEIASKNNVRKWSYVDGILKRWRANGHFEKQSRVEKVTRTADGGIYV